MPEPKRLAVQNGDRVAFPLSDSGMTKREVIASRALQGILANTAFRAPPRPADVDDLDIFAALAVTMADELLLALERRPA